MRVSDLIILGPQGSGKGTQAKLLAERFNYAVLGAGDLLRDIAKTGTSLGQRVNQTINVESKLVEAEIISEVFRLKLQDIPADQKVILESYPRNLEQYQYLKEFWPKLSRGDFLAIYIDLSEEESIRRLSNRYICNSCGEIFTGFPSEICPICGQGRLIKRQDDKPEAVKKRLAWSSSQLLPLVQEFENEGKLLRVDGLPSIEEVNREILTALDKS